MSPSGSAELLKTPGGRPQKPVHPGKNRPPICLQIKLVRVSVRTQAGTLKRAKTFLDFRYFAMLPFWLHFLLRNTQRRLRRSSHFAEVRMQHHKKVQLNPHLYQAHLELSLLLIKAGKAEQARAHCRTAEQSPDPEVRNAAANLLRQLGK